MLFSLVLNVKKDVIEVYNNKDIELFYQDLFDVTLKYDWCIIGQTKKYYLVLEVVVSGSEGRLPIIVFFNPHLMVDICQIKLDEMSSLI